MALAIGAVDEASVNYDLLSLADVVFLCTPISQIVPTLPKICPYISERTILTDVGSVKAPIVQECSQLWPNFVGGHPMAGTANWGITAAERDLFVGKVYVLTPTEMTPPRAVKKVETIVRSLGSLVYHCSPELHDRAVAWISHLPVIISASLIRACLQEGEAEVRQLAQEFASSGFRDTSRVGGGNPELGVMMARYNRQALLRSLVQYCHSLEELINCIEQENWESLQEILSQTQQGWSGFRSCDGE
jgi:arogenate dehydrogenase (NADP+)